MIGQSVVSQDLSSDLPSRQADGCAPAPCASGPGTVYWITGLSAAGKTTVATGLCNRLRDAGRTAILLDGDRLRDVLGAGDAFDPADRLRLAMTYARLCRELAGQGVDVVCATISMFHAVRDWNRANIARYREIYLRVPADVLSRRDPKGIYARHRSGLQDQVVGRDLVPELPRNPDLTIDNDGAVTPADAVERIWSTQVAA